MSEKLRITIEVDGLDGLRFPFLGPDFFLKPFLWLSTEGIRVDEVGAPGTPVVIYDFTAPGPPGGPPGPTSRYSVRLFQVRDTEPSTFGTTSDPIAGKYIPFASMSVDDPTDPAPDVALHEAQCIDIDSPLLVFGSPKNYFTTFTVALDEAAGLPPLIRHAAPNYSQGANPRWPAAGRINSPSVRPDKLNALFIRSFDVEIDGRTYRYVWFKIIPGSGATKPGDFDHEDLPEDLFLQMDF